MKARALSLGHGLGHVFDEEAYAESNLVDGEAFFCIHCDELYVYFIDDDELIGGRTISNPEKYSDESIINAHCPVERLLS